MGVKKLHITRKTFWSMVDMTGTACWLWRGRMSGGGYGSVCVLGKRWPALRLAYTLAVAEIPNGSLVLHHCDNPPCVRPDHLFVGTHRDNSRDMASKGRAGTQRHPETIRRGEKASRAKLTEKDVIAIRCGDADESQRITASRFGVHQTAISRILRDKTWRHVTRTARP